METTKKQPIPIEGAYRYELTPDRKYVRNRKTYRLLRRYWTGKGYYSLIRADDGRMRQFYHHWNAVPSQSHEDVPYDAEPIPGYPDYRITDFGAVWRAPTQRKERPRLLATHERHGRDYVQIKDKHTERHNKRVGALVHLVFGFDPDKEND